METFFEAVTHPFVLAPVAWILGWLLAGFARRLPPAGGELSSPVDVVIPARNEAHNIAKLLGDLEVNRPPGTRVIVVDDSSEDGTAEIARRFDFVEVVTAPPLPDGWVGKCWACHNGALQAGTRKDTVLAFLDADVRLHGDALARLAARQCERGGITSVWPYHDVEKPYEHLSAPFNVAAGVFVGCASPIPFKRGVAAGPVLVTNRADYDQTGGHAAIRTNVVEDFAIARLYRQFGKGVEVFAGCEQVSFRMYPLGVRDLVEGWTKNSAIGSRETPLWRFFAAIFWLIAAVGALTWYGGALKLPALIQYLAFALQMYFIFRQFGRFGIGTALLYPVLYLFALVILARSVLHSYVLRRVGWRGRQIRISRDSG